MATKNWESLVVELNETVFRFLTILANAAKQSSTPQVRNKIVDVTTQFGAYAKTLKAAFKEFSDTKKNIQEVALSLKTVNAEASKLPSLLDDVLTNDQKTDLENLIILLCNLVIQLAGALRTEVGKPPIPQKPLPQPPSNGNKSNGTIPQFSNKSGSDRALPATPKPTTPPSPASNAKSPPPARPTAPPTTPQKSNSSVPPKSASDRALSPPPKQAPPKNAPLPVPPPKQSPPTPPSQGSKPTPQTPPPQTPPPQTPPPQTPAPQTPAPQSPSPSPSKASAPPPVSPPSQPTPQVTKTVSPPKPVSSPEPVAPSPPQPTAAPVVPQYTTVLPPILEGKRKSIFHSKAANEALSFFDPNYNPAQPKVISHSAVPFSKILQHVEQLKTPNHEGKLGFQADFEQIEDLTVSIMMNNDYSTAFNQMKKNRYDNVLPPESSRVILSELVSSPGSDYINANWIMGLVPNSKTAYIATQGPIDDTISDFWRMVWESNSSVIVMLAREIENGAMKCAHYWPETEWFITIADSFTESKTAGLQVVFVRQTQLTIDIIQREFTLNHCENGQSRNIIQLHYVSWPDLGVPDTTGPFLNLVELANKANSTRGPLTIHCSAGVGRTGSFITFHSTIEKIIYDKKKNPNQEPMVDILQTICGLRSQRPGMVQTEEQYLFCWMAVADTIRNFQSK